VPASRSTGRTSWPRTKLSLPGGDSCRSFRDVLVILLLLATGIMVIDRVPGLGTRAAYFKQRIRNKLIEHKHYVAEHGEDMPEISGWQWGQAGPRAGPTGSTAADNV
jgi:XFP C-terminal domain